MKMDSSDWLIWFWFLLVVLVLAFCICSAATLYGCFCALENSPCNACCCRNDPNYRLLREAQERHNIFEQAEPRIQDFIGEYTSESIIESTSEMPQNFSPHGKPSASQILKARRLMPFCKIFKFRQNSRYLVFGKSRKCKNDVCPICIEQYFQGDCLVLCPCKHAYHIGCLEGWFKVKGTCPLCKSPIRNKLTERSPILYPYV